MHMEISSPQCYTVVDVGIRLKQMDRTKDG